MMVYAYWCSFGFRLRVCAWCCDVSSGIYVGRHWAVCGSYIYVFHSHSQRLHHVFLNASTIRDILHCLRYYLLGNVDCDSCHLGSICFILSMCSSFLLLLVFLFFYLVFCELSTKIGEYFYDCGYCATAGRSSRYAICYAYLLSHSTERGEQKEDKEENAKCLTIKLTHNSIIMFHTGSSTVEEEHQTWYFVTMSLSLLLAYYPVFDTETPFKMRFRNVVSCGLSWIGCWVACSRRRTRRRWWWWWWAFIYFVYSLLFFLSLSLIEVPHALSHLSCF